MFIRIFLLVSLCFAVIPECHSRESNLTVHCKMDPQQKISGMTTDERPCYLEVRQTLLVILDHAPHDAWARQQLQDLSSQVKNELTVPALKNIDRLYLEGYRSFDEGRWLEARNYWLEYSQIRHQTEGFAEDKQWREVQSFFEPLNLKQVEEKKSLVLKANDDPAPPRHPTKKNEDSLFLPATQLPPKIRDKTPAKKHKSSLSSHDILKKARQAQSNGQFDSALRFYKLAEKVDPESTEVKNEMSALEKEMQ